MMWDISALFIGEYQICGMFVLCCSIRTTFVGSYSSVDRLVQIIWDFSALLIGRDQICGMFFSVVPSVPIM